MAASPENVSMALFCDFENVALGVRDANYEKFDIKLVLERLLLKGSIVVKKAYCDWERYKGFKSAMHEANFELIEIPHVRQSGKNSADIRLVVDALDLCYTKSHVDTFVIISGDSDFSPLVSKLRENAKQVIGVGVKQSTSDLLIANCDEFIFYDDLVRDLPANPRREQRNAQAGGRRTPEEDKRRREEQEARKAKAVAIAVETFDALLAERGDTGKIWASVLKEAIKRRKPDFNESYFGFRAFGNLLDEAQNRGLLEVGRDEKSGTYVFRSSASARRLTDLPLEGSGAPPESADSLPPPAAPLPADPATGAEEGDARARGNSRAGKSSRPTRGSGRRRTDGAKAGGSTPPGVDAEPLPQEVASPAARLVEPAPEPVPEVVPEATPVSAPPEAQRPRKPKPLTGRAAAAARKASQQRPTAVQPESVTVEAPTPVVEPAAPPPPADADAPAKAPRARRAPRKAAPTGSSGQAGEAAAEAPKEAAKPARRRTPRKAPAKEGEAG